MGDYLRTYLIGVVVVERDELLGALDVSNCWISWESLTEQAATWTWRNRRRELHHRMMNLGAQSQ
jgi:hypothetical protein